MPPISMGATRSPVDSLDRWLCRDRSGYVAIDKNVGVSHASQGNAAMRLEHGIALQQSICHLSKNICRLQTRRSAFDVTQNNAAKRKFLSATIDWPEPCCAISVHATADFQVHPSVGLESRARSRRCCLSIAMATQRQEPRLARDHPVTSIDSRQ